MLQIPYDIFNIHRFSHRAMATIFEIAIVHEDQVYAEQAAFAAFQEVSRLENELSRFVETSDISRINHSPAGEPIILGIDTWNCLSLCRKISAETKYAFDANTGFWMDCFFNADKSPRTPDAEELAYAADHSGFSLIEFYDDFKEEYDESLPPATIRLKSSPVQLNLGAIGKGYAVDIMKEILQEWDIDTALIHGGGSSVFALGKTGEEGWPLYFSDPDNPSQTLHSFHLQNASISSSGLKKGEHIINPRTGSPVHHHRATWVIETSGSVSDALSTAFMVMSQNEISRYCKNHPSTQAWVLTEEESKPFYFGK